MPELIDSSKWIQFRRGRFSQFILKMLGWTVQFQGLPGTHGILVVYPHTSNVDFFIGILTKWAMGVQVYYLAKDSLFKISLVGWWLRYLGGRPVIRTSPQGYVSELADEMKRAKQFWLVITPEGTGKRTPGWRSGFYRLALTTGYPVGFAFIDYVKKEIGVLDFTYMTGQEELDIERIRQAYKDKGGRFVQNMAPIEFWSPADRRSSVK